MAEARSHHRPNNGAPIGYVVSYADERDGGAYVPALAGGWTYTAAAMMRSRPWGEIRIEPVSEIPEWVES